MKLLKLSAAVAVALATQNVAFAANEEASAEESAVERITITGQVLYNDQVTALKTPTPILDVPQSLSVTTAEDIIKQGFDSIGDIVLYTPGVTQSQGEGHRDAIVIRGVRTTADFFVDGVRDDVQYYRSLYNLEQVEVLRGPNALFFGRGGTGGIINRVTKKAVIGENFGTYLGALDTFGAGTIQLDGNFAVNDKAAFRINGYYEGLDNHRDFFNGDRFGINPTAFFELSDNTTLNVSYEYIDNERFIDRGIPSGSDGRPARELDDITFADPEFNTATVEAHIFRANLTHDFNDNLKGNFAATYSDFDKLYANLFPVSFNEETNIVEIDGYVDTTQRENVTLSANLVGAFTTGKFNHTFVIGGEYLDTRNNNDRFNARFDSIDIRDEPGRRTDIERFLATDPLNFRGGVGVNSSGNETTVDFITNLNDDTEADVEVFSAFIQDEIEVAPWLDVVLGLRFDQFDIRVDNIRTLIQQGVRDITSRTDSEVSPRVGFVLKPQENVSFYGSFSESFLPRSGGQFADLPDNPNTPNDDRLDPNTSENLEFGVKWDFAERLSLTAAVFQIEQSSPQVAAPTIDPGTNIIVDENAGQLAVVDSEIDGFELQVQGQITDWWYLSAGYSYLDGDQVATSNVLDDNGNLVIAQGQENGLRLRELPENTANIWNNFNVTPKLDLGIGLTYQDESFADNGNNTTLPSFVRVDAAAYYTLNEKIRLQLNVENLFDREYFPNSHTSNNITVGAPANARLSVIGRF
ncbi:TonB-dependent receptor [Alteromonadaceae bacterium M269]|nr:TonB-dependent receptor [Alteromonadaceae bacterium M269]